MKVLKKGRANTDKLWIGRRGTCENCGCKFKLTAADKVKFVDNQHDGEYGYEVKCPTCKERILINA